MPFTPNLITRPYSILPVPSNFIPSSPLSPPSSPAPNSQQPRQRIFWVGCSDSSITETDCLAVDREEIFVHRNLGNILSNGDLSSESAVEWALDVSKVDHIIICGHYDCALIEKDRDLPQAEVDPWYKDVTKLHASNKRHLSTSDEFIDDESRNKKLEEAYVLAEVDWLKRQEKVKKAMKDRGLQIHAFVFDRLTERCVRLVGAEKGEEGETQIRV